MSISILFLIILLCCRVEAVTVVVGQPSAAAPPAAYCAGTELFCEDFEGTDTAWDASAGSEDCDGYDADGDYCDDETTTYAAGAEAFGCRGVSTSYYVFEALTSSTSEFYMEFWYRSTDVTDVVMLRLRENADGGSRVWFDTSTDDMRLIVKGGSTVITPSPAVTLSDNTWYHIGMYYKAETAALNNDGIIRIWMNTDGGTFDAADIKHNATNVDTGSVDEGYLLYGIRLVGPSANDTAYVDNVRVVSGSPAWGYE